MQGKKHRQNTLKLIVPPQKPYALLGMTSSYKAL